MKDNREFNYCKKCNIPKLPRMHHCSSCNSCCIKYDHHCGMVMNCIGVNNYHLFVQFLLVTFCFMVQSSSYNLYYNFWSDFKYEYSYITRVLVFSTIILIGQLASVYYAYSMFGWYWGMATRNMHCVEENQSGAIYNKADFWGLVGDMKKKDVGNAPMPGENSNGDDPSKRIYLFTKSSKFNNFTTMM